MTESSAESSGQSWGKSSGKSGRKSGRVSLVLLGAFGLLGLVGFAVTFGMILARTAPAPLAAVSFMPPPAPAAAAPAQPGPKGDAGPQGPQGLRGPAGDPGIRIVRADCASGRCPLECGDDEIILIAHCGAGRSPADYQSERSATCRGTSRAKIEIVAACTKMPAH